MESGGAYLAMIIKHHLISSYEFPCIFCPCHPVGIPFKIILWFPIAHLYFFFLFIIEKKQKLLFLLFHFGFCIRLIFENPKNSTSSQTVSDFLQKSRRQNLKIQQRKEANESILDSIFFIYHEKTHRCHIIKCRICFTLLSLIRCDCCLRTLKCVICDFSRR